MLTQVPIIRSRSIPLIAWTAAVCVALLALSPTALSRTFARTVEVNVDTTCFYRSKEPLLKPDRAFGSIRRHVMRTWRS